MTTSVPSRGSTGKWANDTDQMGLRARVMRETGSAKVKWGSRSGTRFSGSVVRGFEDS